MALYEKGVPFEQCQEWLLLRRKTRETFKLEYEN